MALLTQRRWRIVGGLALAASAALAVYGTRLAPGISREHFVVYWAVFLFFLVLSLGMAMLDFRHARRQYVKARQDLYRETLGDEAFRRALSEAHRKARQDSGKGK